jgi:hypothetical protein
MKNHLLLFILLVTPVNTVLLVTRGGCGTFVAAPLLLGWHITSSILGKSFADRHTFLVAASGAFVTACFVAAIVGVIATILRKKGRLASARSLAILFVLAGVVYIGLGLLNYPQWPCL